MGSKRGHYGTGVVEHPLGSGKLWARVSFQGKQYWKRAASRGHARDLVHQMHAAILKGEFPPKPKERPVLFDELLESYRTEKQREGKAVLSSEIGYRRLLERFGGRPAASITTREIKAFRDELLPGHKPSTVNRHLTILRAILRMGVRDKRIDASALPEVELLEENNERGRWLTEEEEARLMAAAPERLRPALLVDIHTGLRRRELLELRWADVDFVGETIRVQKSKSGKGRNVSMDSVVIRTLLGLKAAWRERRRARVVRQSEGIGYVFSAPRGGFMSNLNRVWYPLLERAGLRGLHFHDLRHTFGSRLVMSGVPIYTVQKLMGHKKIEMTMRYAHLAPGHLRAAVEVLATEGPKPWATASEIAGNGTV